MLGKAKKDTAIQAAVLLLGFQDPLRENGSG